MNIWVLKLRICSIFFDNYEFYVIGVCLNMFVDIDGENCVGVIKDGG